MRRMSLPPVLSRAYSAIIGERTAPTIDVSKHYGTAGRTMVLGDAGLLEYVFSNILENAVRAGSFISTRRTVLDISLAVVDNRRLEARFADNVRIPDEAEQRFRRKPNRDSDRS